MRGQGGEVKGQRRPERAEGPQAQRARPARGGAGPAPCSQQRPERAEQFAVGDAPRAGAGPAGKASSSDDGSTASPPPPASKPPASPACAPTVPLSVRESRMPTSRPLITSADRAPAPLRGTASRQRRARQVRRHADHAHGEARCDQPADGRARRGRRQHRASEESDGADDQTTCVPGCRPAERSGGSPVAMPNCVAAATAVAAPAPTWNAVGHRAQQRLAIVDVGHGGPGGERQQREQGARRVAGGIRRQAGRVGAGVVMACLLRHVRSVPAENDLPISIRSKGHVRSRDRFHDDFRHDDTHICSANSGSRT